MLLKIDRRLIVTVLLMTGLIFLIWLASLFMVKGPQKIGATYMTLNNSFYQAINEELKKATDLKGDILYTRDPALDVDKQCQQIEEFIEKKVSVIVINPVDGENKQIQQALRRAHKKKIKIIAVDSQLSDSSYIDSSIVSDNFRAGKLSAQYLMKHEQAANILVLRHWNALSVKERYAGFLATLDSTKYQVTQNVETLGQTDIALKQTLKTLQQGNKKFDAIMALDDQSAIGALAALDSLALKDSIPVYGIDGSSDMKKLLLSDPNAKATVAQSPIALGKKVVQTCYQLFDQRKVKKEIIVPVYLLTKDNIKNYDVSGWQ